MLFGTGAGLVWSCQAEACSVRPFGSGPRCPEGIGVVGGALGVGARGTAEDLLHHASEGRRLPDLLGVPGH
jgi:hypothetical protein